jgi:hypothetical protein
MSGFFVLTLPTAASTRLPAIDLVAEGKLLIEFGLAAVSLLLFLRHPVDLRRPVLSLVELR